VPRAGVWRRWRRLPLGIPDWEGFKLGSMGGKGSTSEWEWEWELEFGGEFRARRVLLGMIRYIVS